MSFRWWGVAAASFLLVLVPALGVWFWLDAASSSSQKWNIKHAVLDVAVSPDGQLLASAETSRERFYQMSNAPMSTEATQTVELRQATDGRVVRTLVGHSDDVWSVVFSPNGALLATGSADHTVKIWNVVDGALITTLPIAPAAARSLAWSPDGQTLAISDEAVIMLWRVHDWHTRLSIDAPGWHIGFSPDGRFIAAASDRNIRVWEVHNGQPVTTIFAGGRTFAWSPDGQFIATVESATKEQDIEVWHVKDGSRVANLEGHTGHVYSLAWSPDGHTLASGSGERLSSTTHGDKTIRLWQTSDWQLRQTIRAHGDVILSLTITPDNKYLVSGSLDGTVKWWRLV